MATDRILITGSTGFVGRHVVQALLEQDFPITLTVRNAHAIPPAWRQNSKIDIIDGIDLASPTSAETALELAFTNVRTVVHLAGLAHIAAGDKANPGDQFMQANSEATRRLVEVARTRAVGSFIHLSSLAAITANATEATIDDRTVFPAETPYGRSKLAAEQHLHLLSDAGIFAVSLRPPLIVGAEARGNWALLQRLAITGLPLPLASVATRRSFVSIRSVAEAIVTLCSSNWPSNLSGAYCLADPESQSLPEVLTALRKGMGLSPGLIPFPPAVFAVVGALTGRRRQFAGLTGALEVDASRFYATFAFAPTLPLKEAIRQSGTMYSEMRKARRLTSSG